MLVSRFVPLAFTGFLLGTPEEEEEGEADKAQKEVLASLEDAEVSPPLDESVECYP